MAMFEKKEEDALKGHLQGPEISEANVVEAATEKADYNAKLLLESYWCHWL
jgi:hypothetical protein